MPAWSDLPGWVQSLLPIVLLLIVTGLVVARLPKVDLGHSPEFIRRRFLNWFPLGMTYAFLYMGRYNLAAAKNDLEDLITNADFGTIKFYGTVVYAISFLLNGPLTDRFGGRATILAAAAGSAAANLAMGAVLLLGVRENVVPIFTVLYAVNMYFQSFGAVSIVKVNAHWFHLRERGTFGGIFGILISLGLYFAYDWCAAIAGLEGVGTEWVFFIPAIILIGFFFADYLWVRDSPADAGMKDFETGDASWGVEEKPKTVGDQLRAIAKVALMMARQPVILIIAGVEFCSGFVRSALMDWYAIFSTQTGMRGHDFVADNWGMMQCLAGILGGVVAGIVSDRLFQSRRGPVAAMLYGILVGGGVAMILALTTSPVLSVTVVIMMLAIIGVHGMLSGAASMDFGGKQNVGIVVGIIDGLVYMGQGFQYGTLGLLVPEGEAAAVPENWSAWPLGLLIMSVVGVGLASLIWNAKPQGKSAPAH
jgi:MFS transporter, OPA family, glycerol-3-phosphate transporter